MEATVVYMPWQPGLTRHQWKRINHKQRARWQHLSRLKSSAFFSLQKICYLNETQQLILGISYAILWMMEPYWNVSFRIMSPKVTKECTYLLLLCVVSLALVSVLYLPWLPCETWCNLKYSNLCRIIQDYQGMYLPVAVVCDFPSLQVQCCTCLGYFERHDKIWNVCIWVASFKVAKECTYLLLLLMVFLQCSDSAVLTLATLGDTMQKEIFKFVSNH
jgi:hypothetical protein